MVYGVFYLQYLITHLKLIFFCGNTRKEYIFGCIKNLLVNTFSQCKKNYYKTVVNMLYVAFIKSLTEINCHYSNNHGNNQYLAFYYFS